MPKMDWRKLAATGVVVVVIGTFAGCGGRVYLDEHEGDVGICVGITSEAKEDETT